MKLKPWLGKTLAVFMFAAIGVVLFWGFMQGRKELAMEQERERPIKIPSRVSIRNGITVLSIGIDAQKKSGIATLVLESASHQDELNAYGKVLSFQDLVYMRDRYAAADARVEKMKASFATSSDVYKRRKELYERREISLESLQSIEKTWRFNKADLFSSQESLQAVKDRIQQKWGPVLARWVFEASPEFARLRSQKSVLIQVTLPSDAMIESPPESALIDTSYGTKISANLVSSSPQTDPRIQGQSFFYMVTAPHCAVLPGMNVSVFLPIGSEIQGVVIPYAGVVWWQGKAWIYVQRDAAHFVRREVSLDTPVKNGWFVKRSCSSGERIVIKGAQLLLSEEFRTQIKKGQEE